MKSFLRLIFFLFPLVAFAEKGSLDNLPSQVRETLKGATTMVNLEGEPSALVHGAVNAITGDYCETETDLQIAGAYPLNVTRSYTSSDIRISRVESGPLESGWHLNYHGKIVFTSENVAEFKNYISHEEGGGVSTLYEGKYTTKLKDLKLSPKLIKHGLTNAGAGEIGARTNRKNSRAACAYENPRATVKMSNGTVRTFSRRPDNNCFFDLVHESLPNGSGIRYSYDPLKRLQRVDVVNNQNVKISGFRLKYPSKSRFKKDPHVSLYADDGRKVRYAFEKKKDQYFLSRVDRLDAPTVQYEYDATFDQEQRIVKKSLPAGRFLEIDYYRVGSNYVGGEKVKIGGVGDYHLGRVRELKAPVGSDGSSRTLYTFKYKKTFHKTGNLAKGLTTVEDGLGRKTCYHWDDHSRLSRVVAYKGNAPYTTDRLYWGADNTSDAGHLISRVFKGEGQGLCCRHYIYDKKGNVIEKQLLGVITGGNEVSPAVNPSGTPLANGCDCYIEKFSFNQQNLPVSEENNRRKITIGYLPDTDLVAYRHICDLEGNIKVRTFYEYDADGVQILEMVDDGSGCEKEDLTGVTERRLVRTTPRVQAPFGLPQIVEEKYWDSGQEVLLKKTVNHHDLYGRLTRQEVYDALDQFAYALEYEYDAQGNVIRETDALGFVTESRYDVNGNKVFEKIDGAEVEYRYDRADRMIAKVFLLADGTALTERFQYDILGNRHLSTDIHGNEIRYFYDGLGRACRTEYPGGITTRLVYNALNQPVVVEDGNGHKLRLQYNIHGEPTRLFYPNGTEERFQYSIDGLLIAHTAANGTVTNREYDYQNRLIYQKVTNTEGDVQESSWSYDAFHLLASTDPSGTTHYEYDAAGRLIKTEKHGVRTLYVYDALGRKQKTIHNDIVTVEEHDFLDRVVEKRQEDLNGTILSRVSYEYDARGNCTATKVDTGSAIAVERCEYDPLGHCIRKVDALGNETRTRIELGALKTVSTIAPDGVVTTAVSDAFGRVVKRTLADPYGTELRVEESLYDSVGNRIKLIESVTIAGELKRKNVTRWEYDWHGRITAKTEAADTPEQKRTTLAYHPDGSKAMLTKPDGVEIYYCDDGFKRLTRLYSSDGTIDYRYVYDSAGRIVSVDDAIHQKGTLRAYDEAGNLIEEQLGNGLTLAYTYDALQRPASFQLPDGSGASFAYESGRMQSITRTSPTGSERYSYRYHAYDLRGNVLSADGFQKSYDLLGRLTAIETPVWKETVNTYDSVGNITSLQIQDQSGTRDIAYRYDAQRQLIADGGRTYLWDSQYNCVEKEGEPCTSNALNQLTAIGDRTFQYDLNGNLLTDGERTYSYDALDRLIEVTAPGSLHRYTYDAFNRRLSKNDERYLYMGDNEVGMVDSADTLAQFRLLGPGPGAEIAAAVAIEVNSTTYGVVHDHAGNVACLTDYATGTPIESYTISAFGILDTPSPTSPWLFSSKRLDPETGFYNFGRRYYSPMLMRWITPDPIDRAGGPNVYAYVTNNPLVTMDLYGFLGVDRHRHHYCNTHANFARRNNMLRRTLSFPGHFIKAIGSHLVPTHIGRDTVRAIGHFLAGHSFRNFHTTTCQSQPRRIDIPGKKMEGYRFIHVNGVLGYENEVTNAAEALSRAYGGVEVTAFFTPTRGLVNDLIYCAAGRLGFFTKDIKFIADNTKTFLENNNDKIIAESHSRGCEYNYQAFKRLTTDERQRIIALGIGGARLFPTGFCGDTYNLVGTGDPIPYLASPIESWRARNGDPRFQVCYYNSVGYWGLDHAFNGPTYSKAIGEFALLNQQYFGG